MTKQYAFYYNVDACIGCKVCMIACKDKNNLAVGLKYRKVVEYAGGSWSEKDGVVAPQNVFTYSVSISCMHCQNPVCKKVCPTGAMTKREDGIVYVDEAKCIGCGYCAWACPYGAPRLNVQRKVMGKCDFCRDLIDQGENPVCIDACPMRCIEYGELEELKAKYGDKAQTEPLPLPDMTSPSVVFKPSRLNPDNKPGMVVNAEEELL
jgi:anaerobic dimethyl sulfoxide reductase subunit B (iron-sulfur subunit)